MSQSLDRGLNVLDAISGGAGTLDELAVELDVHKSTVLRLLRTLEAHHFVRREGTRHYRLGSALFDLANRALEERDVRRACAPALADLNARTGHTVHLATYEDGEAVYVDKFEGRHAVRMYSRIGKRAPLHCTAVGKVLVGALDPARRAEVAAGLDFVAMTPNTITGADSYLAELDRVAGQGHAVDNAEHEDFVHCIAAPVRGPGGAVVAAVSLSVPRMLLDFDGLLALVPELTATARAASADNGWISQEKPEIGSK
jgi:DNA-binding IclR family transcriptional regulator